LLKLNTHHLQQAGLNNRGEFEQKNLTVFTSIKLLKLLKGRTPARTVALGDGSCNVTTIPFILGGNIRLATAFIGAVTASQVLCRWWIWSVLTNYSCFMCTCCAVLNKPFPFLVTGAA
jgi:hypothetical protein